MDIYNKAIQILKIRPHYSIELARKLSLRGYDKLDIEKVINRLLDEGLINDAEYAQAYLDELIRNKPFGFYMLKAKLMSRGVASNEAENILRENFPQELEREIAKKVIEKEKETDKLKLAAKLQRKGFRSEVIQKLIYSGRM